MSHRPSHFELRDLVHTFLGLLRRPTHAETQREEGDRRRRTVLAFWWIGALPWPIIFAAFYGVILSCPAGAVICTATSLCMMPIPWIARSARGSVLAAHWLVAVMVAALTALGCITGGAGAPALTWLLSVPLVAIHVTGLRAGSIWGAAALVVLISFDVIKYAGVAVPQQLSREQIDLLGMVGNVGVTIMVTTIAIAYDSQRLAALSLARERQASLSAALEHAEEQARQIERASEALRKSEARYHSLVVNSPMGMYFYELDDRDQLVLTEANPAAEQLTGVDSSKLIGRSLEVAFPGVRGTEIPARYRAAAADGVPWSVEKLPYDDGSVSGVFELRAFQTGPRKMVVVFMNVTERVEAEEAVRAGEREVALQAGKAEVATHVLHNVGNVLSRVKVSATLLRDRIAKSESPTVGLVAGLLCENRDRIAAFLEQDERGRALPSFLEGLAGVLAAEQAAVVAELKGMSEAIEHIARVIGMQQVHSKGCALLESVRPADIVEQALSISVSNRLQEVIEIVRECDELSPLTLERHKVLQILVNLFNNAVHAVSGVERPRITCRVERVAQACGDVLRFTVADNGVGISAEQLPRIFTFGFTTRRDGHGFGLHSSANLALEMRGTLRVASAGEGQGAAFTLDVPLHADKVPT